VDRSSNRTGWILAASVAAWNLLQNSVPRPVYGWLNLVGSVVVVGGAGPRLGLSRDELGLGPGAVRRGGRVAAPFAAAIVGGVAAVISSPSGRRAFRDERVERRGGSELARETLFRIPVGTGVFEELLFRGLVEGWARDRFGERRATVVSSVAFGFWHVIPTMRTLAVYRFGRFRATPLRTALGVGGAVAGTAVAGAGFSAIGRHAGSVAAPAMVHAVINSAAYAAAWMAAPSRRS
jgi:hypothetical protein